MISEFDIDAKSAILEFSGERLIPGQAELDVELEHLHRYAMVCALVKGKRVLDVASGEGYGSGLLAAYAKEVVGVDVSLDVVQHASKRYQTPNLRFLQGSCSALPLDKSSVDIVVSFETIEHHDEHDAMMLEVKRVLRPGGVLIISSPDKLEYSDKPGYQNKYHVRELYRSEFHDLLGRFFSRHRVYGQRVAYGSVVLPSDGSGVRRVSSYSMPESELILHSSVPNAVYLIAVASDGRLPDLPVGIFDLPLLRAPMVTKHIGEAARLGSAVGDLQSSLQRVLEERDALKRSIDHLNDMLATAAKERDQVVASLGQTVESLIVDRDSHREAVGTLQQQLLEREALRAAEAERLGQLLAERDQVVASLGQTVESLIVDQKKYLAEIARLTESLSRTEQDLVDLTRVLDNIVKSASWRYTSLFRKARRVFIRRDGGVNADLPPLG